MGLLDVVAEGHVLGKYPGFAGIRLGEVESVVLNVTVTVNVAEPTEPSLLTVFPSDVCEIPLASNLDFHRRTDRPEPRHRPARHERRLRRTRDDRGDNRFGNVRVIIDFSEAFIAPTTTLFE